MPYSKKMLEYCENPKNIGSLDENDISVGTGSAGSPVCGDMLKFQIKVKDNVIVDAKFKTFGCGGAISSSSLITEKVIGKTLEEALKLKNKDIIQELELPKVKIHCSVLAEEAVHKAVEDYKNKNSKNSENS
ncbi:MAG: iron-sulfur cluster assembly scaffold protein [Rickettsiales bacterium]|jgi:nitrogen fixation NifU-like protein|nr:iron-sulfur cluster assembly scaffold protein [Rickettsiales bacterium]